MKNPHGVEPTRYMKKKEIKTVNANYSFFGPTFDISEKLLLINEKCDDEVNYINNNGNKGYECHPEYKSSLFVNTNEPEKENIFAVLDYEVFAHE